VGIVLFGSVIIGVALVIGGWLLSRPKQIAAPATQPAE
jgi:hypothetical protein